MRKVTLRNVTAHKLRVLLVSSVIALGVGFVAGSIILTGTINRTFDDLFATVYEDVDVVVRSAGGLDTGQGETIREPVPEALVQQVQTVPGVAVAEGYLQGFTQLVGKDGEPVSANGAPTFGGMWTDTPELNPFSIVEGAPPRTPDEIVIDKATAEKAKFAVGDRATVLSAQQPKSYAIVGISKFGEVDSPGGSSYSFFVEEEAHRLFNYPDSYTEIDVAGDGSVGQEELRNRVAAAVGPEYEPVTGEVITEENQNALGEVFSFIRTILLVFAGIALFVGAFVINNVFSVLIAQRTRDLALLRAIGASAAQIRRSVLTEAFVIGIVASLIGLVLGIGLAALAISLLGAFGIDIVSGSLVIGPDAVLVSILAGVIVTVFASLWPARRAARTAPLEAMRSSAVEASRISRVRIVSALILLAIGVGVIAFGLAAASSSPYIYVGAGVLAVFIAVAMLAPVICRPLILLLGYPVAKLRGEPGDLARKNAVRSPRRTSATALALTIGVTLVTLTSVVFSSAKATTTDVVDDYFAGDLMVTTQGGGVFGGLSTELAPRLAQLPEVEKVSPQRTTPVGIGGKPAFALAVDAKTFVTMADLQVTSGDAGTLDATQIAMSEDEATARNLKVGDTVPVAFPSGGGDFRVGATYLNTDVVGDFMFDLAAYEANVDERFDSAIYVELASGVDPVAGVASVERLTNEYPNANVQDITEAEKQFTDQIDGVLNGLYGLLVLSVIIALLGIATTLALSVFERTREIGLLRAIGMARKQVRSMIRWEAVFIAIFGSLLGMVLGVGFAAAIVESLADEGFTTFAVSGGRLAVIVIVAGLAALVAAIWPARRAARLDVLKAIATN